ncbi:MAG TPA: TIGR00725 family protein [Dehalococcoidia bacterium]|nr:TIGR00725 family protein [Dehalococcoidia bacterium]
MQISVIGGEGATGDGIKLAEEVGRELARRGVTLVCGGGLGIMEAACRGARSLGGHTIGILPGHNALETPPNQWVEFPVYTGLGFARNSMVVLSGDAVIAIDGSYGTLSEIAFALIHSKPLIGLHTWEFSYAGHNADKLIRALDAVDAVEKAISLAQSRESVLE